MADECSLFYTRRFCRRCFDDQREAFPAQLQKAFPPLEHGSAEAGNDHGGDGAAGQPPPGNDRGGGDDDDDDGVDRSWAGRSVDPGALPEAPVKTDPNTTFT